MLPFNCLNYSSPVAIIYTKLKLRTMKLSTKLIGSLFLLNCLVISSQGQEANSQKFVVHEDQVYPSKVAEYEAAAKLFKETMEAHNPGMSYMAISLDDGRFLYLSPIDNFADLDNNPFQDVVEAMGEEAFDQMMSSYDNTFETHKDYIISLAHDLSYSSGDLLMEGVNYRQLSYHFINPDKWDEAKAIAKEWTELHAAKNAPHGYRMYTGGLGTEPAMIVVRWAKSEAELQAQLEENRQALGDYSDLNKRTMAITRKRETYGAWMKPDLSYQPEAEVAEN